MSNPISKQERSKAKDARQMPTPDKTPKRKPSKKAKPFVVMIKYIKPIHLFKWTKDWLKLNMYASRGVAEEAIKQDKRKHPDRYEYKIVEK